jgi:hypothetical protein
LALQSFSRKASLLAPTFSTGTLTIGAIGGRQIHDEQMRAGFFGLLRRDTSRVKRSGRLGFDFDRRLLRLQFKLGFIHGHLKALQSWPARMTEVSPFEARPVKLRVVRLLNQRDVPHGRLHQRRSHRAGDPD